MKLSKSLTSSQFYLLTIFLFLSFTAPSQAGIFKLLLDAGQEAADVGSKVGRKIDTHLPVLSHLPDEAGVSKVGLDLNQDGSLSLLSDTGQKWSLDKEADISSIFSDIKKSVNADKTKKIKDLKFYISSSELLSYSGNSLLRKMDDLHLTHDGKSYPLSLSTDDLKPVWKIKAKDNITVNVESRSQISESLFQLKRSVNLANMRLVSFSTQIENFPSKVQVATKDNLPALTMINPDFLETSLNILRNQSLVITGKRSGKFLLVQGAKGKESKINIEKLVNASTKNDVNLIIVESSSSAQLGTSKLPWKSLIKQKQLELAFSSETYGGFLSSLSNKEMPLSIDFKDKNNNFVSFQARSQPETKELKSAHEVNLTGELLTHIALHSVKLHMRSESYEKELQQRIIIGVPSWVHISLLLNIVAGCIVISLAFSLWQRIWKNKSRENFNSWLVYLLFQSIYYFSFIFIFLGIFGSTLLITRIFITIFNFLLAIFSILTWPFRTIYSFLQR